ncbi:hypothetical protein F52700_934 [Fusarium sp. NRRL 52700]|nr:hypothetical protein F52700_934 [Fusarium sp. NRRL 52700]
MNCNINPYLLGRQLQRFRQDSPNDTRAIWTEYDLYYFTLCPLSASEKESEQYPLEWRYDTVRLRSSRAEWRSLMVERHPYDDAMREWLRTGDSPSLRSGVERGPRMRRGFGGGPSGFGGR